MGLLSKCVTILVLLVAVVLGILYGILTTNPPDPPVMRDGWFGYGKQKSDVDATIYDYKVSVSDATLEELKYRLEKSRFGEDLEEAQFHYGFSSEYLKEVVDHWKTKYDWRQHEKTLNSYPQFRTKIEGILVHFIRVKPPNGIKGRPLMIVHGWPGSVWEFYKIIPMLTNPKKYGGSDADAFEVIAPSIPGYGFSEAPKQKGFDASAGARIFHKLMLRLDHEQYFVQGGDWGSRIVTVMAQAYPSHVMGLHINLASVPRNGVAMVHQVAAAFLPSVFLRDEQDRKKWTDVSSIFRFFLEESGYFHIQATKPDTVGMGLNDSPAGLAAYILEKFSTATDRSWRGLPDGGLTKRWTLDELLTDVMIYWVTGTITSSVRFYKENIISETVHLWERIPVTVPTGVANFPEEIILYPNAFLAYRFHHMIQTTDMPRGGHFAAFEEPELLANDIRNFVRKVDLLKDDQS